MKSITLIKKQLQRKRNPKVVSTALIAKKNPQWKIIADLLSRPKRKKIIFNLDAINKKAGNSKTIVVPGKVLSEGRITKNVKLVALGFSEKAQRKLKEDKIPFTTISEEIKKNPECKGVEVLK